MESFDAHKALMCIREKLMQELGIEALHPPTRTKGQIFKMPGSEKQFALMIGDQDKATGRWKRDTATVVLEQDAPASLPGVTPVLGEQLASSVLNDTSFSRLKAPNQKLVNVADEAALRTLLAWYAATPTPTAPPKPPSDPNTGTQNNIMASLPTNTILYGPPGTGKTYETARRAVLICDGEAPEGRTELMARYEALRGEQRITFVTFHQSYGYEEFVEGLRPVVDKTTKQVVYEERAGAFKKACDSARIGRLVQPGLAGKPISDRTIWKMGLGVMGTAEGTKVFQYCIENSCVLLGWGEDVDFTECADTDAIRKKLQADKPEIAKLDSQVQYVDAFKNELSVGDIVVVAKGNSEFRAIGEVVGGYEFVEDAPFHQKRPVKWVAVFEAGRPVNEIYTKQFTLPALYKLNPAGIQFSALEKLAAPAANTALKPHVFVIDEINRANISKVFGELITLLEPDKREGALNALSVKLPYSGVDFSVPANLHVVGTMNTADRSIALLDTALRRRFEFEEVLPKPSLLAGQVVDGVELEKLLSALNERVESLYNRDHTIGHAFFMGVKSLPDLESVFRRKVIPLLQEYFYENWSKVRSALNDIPGDFIQKVTLGPVPMDEEDESPEGRVSYRSNSNAFPVAAYKRIYKA